MHKQEAEGTTVDTRAYLFSVKVGDASQNPTIYHYAKTMRTTRLNFYTHLSRGIKVLP